MIGCIYFWGQGVAVDYPQAMAAYKAGAEGGNALCQHQVGMMYCKGLGVDVDYAQAVQLLEMAAAQDHFEAFSQLGVMYSAGHGVTPSFRRAREYFERSIELGDPNAAEDMQTLTRGIQQVTSQRSNHSAPSSLVRDLTHRTLILRTHRPPPSWTSGWRSTARAGRT
jgi:TPR repeat protein